MGATDVGLKREKNEDSYFAKTLSDNIAASWALMIVADGMGGHVSGEIASKMAIDHVSEPFLEQLTKSPPLPKNVGDLLTEMVRNANSEIFSQGTSNSDGIQRTMGTTCTAGMVMGEMFHVSHVGDSRAYLFRNEQLTQLTVDDSWVMEQVTAGNLTVSQARKHPNRNIVTQALGIDGYIDVEEISISLQHGDRIMLCSDGLHGLIADEELGDVLTEPCLKSTVNNLIGRAKEYGGDDNITVVLGEVYARTN
tara:strand:- start:123 stop:878 length:756 start_codon:yes stop_codon:yes gene_type:complete